ncbi:hypothetical protein N4G70_36360 [Streptomyces sp. ASQP_92]|uniref:hypothetical protein n=1 Tax=Streptomyces sp. ASQP_92 TaxID=2979116 RepID=UPI0021C236F4|nr:hypothetical protein [Streptomyces sp. ASQP_92]MCT9094271.1 hypothetical protein [Streptomyces sp. ASQP_92]
MLYVFLGLLVGAALFLIVTLLRRGNTPTEQADGLLIEQRSRTRARSERARFGTFGAHFALPTMADLYRG